MKSAYAYIMDRETIEGYESDEAGRARLEAELKKAKESFKLLLNTGVEFGVVPLGATQCGITFAALAIIDPHSGKIYVFAKEGSGC